MIFRSFYARLSLMFLILVLTLGGVSLAIAFRSSAHLFDEVEQLLNREYAASIAKELQPLVAREFTQQGIQEAIHYMMVLNPMVEIYLVDGSGNILAYFTHPDDRLLRKRINLEPLETFIHHQGWMPLLGDDPRTEGDQKPFSAAALQMGRESGYVYVILRGQSFDRSLNNLQNNYYLNSGMITFVVALSLTLIAGFALFFFLTRRLRRLRYGVMAFERGDYSHRINLSGKDELSSLGRAFNEMAGSIESAMGQLQQAEKQRSELIANISHDLRSPLTSIRLHLETLLLKGQDFNEAERRQYIETSLKNLSGYQKLVKELFDLAKFEARQVTLQITPFSLAELVQDVLQKLTPQAETYAIRFQWTPNENLPVLMADIAMIERVLTNILENALAHSPPEGEIHIELNQQGNFQSITIGDSGPGIASDDLPHIFERFYRADKSRTRGIPGTGLGLAIAKEILELHGGTISVESRENHGATFLVSIPNKIINK